MKNRQGLTLRIYRTFSNVHILIRKTMLVASNKKENNENKLIKN